MPLATMSMGAPGRIRRAGVRSPERRARGATPIVLGLLLLATAMAPGTAGAVELSQQSPKLRGECEFGRSVSLSADGNRALVGLGRGSCNGRGVSVLTRSQGEWSQEAELSVKGAAAGFGESLALSPDGEVAAVGESGEGRSAIVYIFALSASGWKEVATLTPPGEAEPNFGQSLALDDDGETLLIGASGDFESGEIGGAYVFTDSGGSWIQQGPKMTVGEEGARPRCGRWVALSADGETALVGCEEAENAAIFTPTAGIWTERAKLSSPDQVRSVALSADASTALIGASVYVHDGAAWSQQALLPAPTENYDIFSDALSGDGDTALVGFPSYESESGAIGLYERSGTSWSQRGGLLHGCDMTEGAELGAAVALSADARTAIAGGWGDDAAWIFAESNPAVTSVAPQSGPRAGGTEITITGTNLDEVSEVDFGGQPAPSFTIESPTLLRATAPAGTESVPVTVIAPGGVSPVCKSTTYTYEERPPPTITKMKPKSGSSRGGSTVILTGKNLAAVTSVKFGSAEAASFTVDSPESISAVSPAGTTGTTEVTVTTAFGQTAPSSRLRFKFGPPIVGDVSPREGSAGGGALVTVKGGGFATGSATSFTFGKVPAEDVSCSTDTECTMVAPKAAKPGTVDVRARAGGKNSEKVTPDDFFIYR